MAHECSLGFPNEVFLKHHFNGWKFLQKSGHWHSALFPKCPGFSLRYKNSLWEISGDRWLKDRHPSSVYVIGGQVWACEKYPLELANFSIDILKSYLVPGFAQRDWITHTEVMPFNQAEVMLCIKELDSYKKVKYFFQNKKSWNPSLDRQKSNPFHHKLFCGLKS